MWMAYTKGHKMTKLEKAVDHILESDVALYTVLSIVCILLMVLGWNIIVGIKP